MRNPKVKAVAEPEDPIRLALCQVETHPGDGEGNRERLLTALHEAARQGAHIALTPECVLDGYGPQHTPTGRAATREAAVELDGPEIAELRVAAKQLRIALCIGFVERNGELIHNSAVLFDAEGNCLLHYRKVHCRPFESAEHDGVFTPGREFFVADLPTPAGTIRVGTLICFDREITESARTLRAAGAELILCPLACDTEPLQGAVHTHNEAITRVRAAENEVIIAVVNHAGRFNGGSFLVGPGGEPELQLGPRPEVRTVGLTMINTVRELHQEGLGWMGWNHRRPEAY